MYYVTVCSQCGQYLLAKDSQKTRLCPYCGTTILLKNAKRLATAKTAQEASEMIRILKSKGKSQIQF